ncbi:hypothetical protein JJB07_06885 [Tumebacillus sp. ITR2]|uniref:Cytosolic protein n=1 Tax=Tumebacillus amylolyticus TaxID=2801339 RepID=A0ABS1J7Z5_9BACL|nr:DUF6282 family protein [Tumebacillus amylolyticus]MBL0386369.1 hypothetical protein [Tumebacillus amylolyticus]
MSIPFFDLHVHSEPDTYSRRYSPLSLGQEMKAAGAGAVLKSHLTATTSVARMAREQGYPIYGSITLNQYAGGVSTQAVQAALAANGQDAPMVIWFPTLTGHGAKPRLSQPKCHPVLDTYPVKLERVSEEGRLRPDTIDVIQLAVDFGIPMATGHSSKEEVYMLVEEVDKRGGRIMLTHPCHSCTGFTTSEVAELLQSSHVWAEVAILMTKLGYESPDDVLDLLQAIDPGRVCVSTDFGQLKNETVTEGYAWFIEQVRTSAASRGLEIPDSLVEQICRTNPMKFLGV